MPNDEIFKPWIKDHSAALGNLIKHVFAWEEHHYGGGFFSETSMSDVLPCVQHLEQLDHIEDILDRGEFDNYYFCGVHLTRCVNQKATRLMDEMARLDIQKNIGIITNLTMPFPPNAQPGTMNNYNKTSPEQDRNIDTYFWGYDYIHPVEIKVE